MSPDLCERSCHINNSVVFITNTQEKNVKLSSEVENSQTLKLPIELNDKEYANYCFFTLRIFVLGSRWMKVYKDFYCSYGFRGSSRLLLLHCLCCKPSISLVCVSLYFCKRNETDMIKLFYAAH